MQDESLDRARAHQLRTSLAHAVARLFRTSNRAYARALRPLGVSAEQAHVLAVLWLDGAATMGELMDRLALSSGTLTGAIDRMEALGLVRRVVDAGDRRAVRVQAAPWPKARRERLLDTLMATEADLFEPLSAREREQLGRLLARVLARA